MPVGGSPAPEAMAKGLGWRGTMGGGVMVWWSGAEESEGLHPSHPLEQRSVLRVKVYILWRPVEVKVNVSILSRGWGQGFGGTGTPPRSAPRAPSALRHASICATEGQGPRLRARAPSASLCATSAKGEVVY